MADRDSYVKTGVDVDDASFNRLINRYKAAIRTVGDMRQSLVSADRAAQDLGRDAVASIDKAEKSTAKWVARLDELAKKRLRGTLPSQSGSVDDLRLGGGRGGINLARADSLATTTGRALRGLGQEELGGALMKIGDAAQIGDTLSRAAEGTGAIAKAAQSLLSVAGPVAIAVGLATTAFAVLTSEMEKGKTAVQEYIDGQKAEGDARLKAARDLRTLTSEQAKERSRDLQEQISINNEQLKRRTEQRDNTKRDLDEAIKNEDNLKIMALGQTFKQLEEDTNRLTGESLKLKLEYIATTAIIGPLIKMREQETALIQEQLDRKRQFTEVMSQEDKEAKTSDLQAQIEFNKKWLAENAARRYVLRDEAIVEVYDKLDAETKKLTLDLESLKNTMPGVVDRSGDSSVDDLERSNSLEGELIDKRKVETEWILKAASAMDEFADATERIADERALSKFREQQDFDIKRARDSAGFARKQAADDAKYYKDRAKSIASFQAEQAKSDNEASKARIKAIADANDAQIKAAEDFAKTVRGFTEQINEAGANLDAIGVRNAQRGLKDATDEYNREKKGRDAEAKKRLDEIAENAKDERDQRAADFAAQLAEADEQHREQREADAAEFRERQRIEDEDRRLRLQRQQEDYARQDAARRAAFDKQIQNLRNQLLEPEEDAKEASYGRQRQALNNFLNGAVADINAAKAKTSAPASTSGTVYNKGVDTGTVYNKGVTTVSRASSGTSANAFSRSFAGGGFPPLNKAVMVGELGPEPVIFKDPAQIFRSGTSVGGSTYNFNGNISVGGNPAPSEFYEMARTAFEGILDEAFPS